MQKTTARRYAAHVSWAKTIDRSARTAPARKALFQKFYDAVDDRITDPAARQQAAESAYRAHFTRLSLKGQAARRAKALRPPDDRP